MQIMGNEKVVESKSGGHEDAQGVEDAGKSAENAENAQKSAENGGKPSENHENGVKTEENDDEKPENVFSEENLTKTSDVEGRITLDSTDGAKTMQLTASDKTGFIDAIVNNTRFTKSYSLFGGHLTLTLRSLTNDEVNALSAWIVKQGSNDSAGMLAGRYRKFLVAAQVESYNGTKMPPLEEPLFPMLGSDGKTVDQPGWINRSAYWDGLSVGVFNAIMGCISDFDERYALLCRKAEDSNFWLPDTP